jgi:hypothetical protein
MNSLHNTLQGTRPTYLRAGYAVALTALCLLFAIGCKKTVDDATLTTNVKAAITGDAAISQQPISVAVQAGVVTLTGNVGDETASSVAAQDAARVAGVKEVVNSLQVAGLNVAPTITSPAAPTVARPTTRAERQVIARHESLPPPVATPSAPAGPPPPVFQNVDVPAGTTIPVRITETLSSESSQDGQPFHGIVTHEVVMNGYVVIPGGAPVTGRVIDAKDATHFKGSSGLTIELTSLSRHGNAMQISTEPYSVAGKGRGVNTAEKVGGGAAIGAVLGGIFGGGKGAAIGAGAGAGGGAILQGATRGQQVTIPSESIIRFRLANSITVRTAEQASDEPYSEPAPGLQPRQ